MDTLRLEYISAVMCCALAACGEPPEPPGAAEPRVADPAGGGDMAVLGARPAPMSPEAPAPRPTDAGAPASEAEPTPASEEPGARARQFAACARFRVLSCDYIYIAMQEEGTDLCVQLSLDNCSTYQRPGLPVDLPVPWRLASGSVGTSAEGCAPDNYDADSAPIRDAAGSIDWNDIGRRPSELVIDITIEPARSPGIGLDAGTISLATSELVEALPDCDS